MGSGAVAQISGGSVDEVQSLMSSLNEYEQIIVNWGQTNPGVVLKARILQQASPPFKKMPPDDIRILFASLADRLIGEVVGDGDRLGWRWSQ
ncbi:hypothetical protein [Nostoc piscinale]|nr:hypothetical protein [Nostoc piscinale]